ncbi:DNA repair protein XRCC3 [Acipenser oxyrinchus oxyrinchus]|uniref:DNA repair protein XRCC3 n=1 Tax=Acipenser oxyrinchus oxyrinchus TaxID=40147 RepID=A0AAD8CGL4_ACIOX|nr:DNA repair protein XRCC3 [Acipenser oxyrinchus oxyrinchus]
MDWGQVELNPKVVHAVKRANVKTFREVLSLSGPDLQRLTKLSHADVHHLQKTVAAAVQTDRAVTGIVSKRCSCIGENALLEQHQKLSLGCPVMDSLLRGASPAGYRRDSWGELSRQDPDLHAALLVSAVPRKYGGLEAGAVYICTEDTFPTKRLQQLSSLQHKLRPEVPADVVKSITFCDNIYIEHAGDVDSLNSCISKRVPILLSRGLVRLVVVDSIAALFRCEFEAKDALLRAKHLLAFGATLHSLSHRFKTPIVCVNQVADAVGDSDLAQSNFGLLDKKVLPTLGITWSNQLLIRLMVSRTRFSLQERLPGLAAQPWHLGSVLRTMEVVFAPHLPQSFCYYTVSIDGVRGVKEEPAS